LNQHFLRQQFYDYCKFANTLDGCGGREIKSYLSAPLYLFNGINAQFIANVERSARVKVATVAQDDNIAVYFSLLAAANNATQNCIRASVTD